jgi:hypothetical protein
MSGCNCIEQKHGGVPQRSALQTLRSEVQSPDVLHARVLNQRQITSSELQSRVSCVVGSG